MNIRAISKWVLIILTLSLVLSFAVFKIDDPDTMQYLASGKEIIHHGFNHACVFNYSSNTCQIVYNEWLFDVFTYWTYSLGGFNALVWLQVSIILGFFSLVYWYQKKENYSIGSSMLLIVIAIITAMERFMLRADLLALLIMVGMYLVLRMGLKDPESDKKLYWYAGIVLGLQLLWTNIHGSFPLGWAIIGAFLTAETFYIFLKRPGSALKFKFLSAIFLGSILVSFLNPYGFKAFALPFHFYFGAAEFHSQIEFASPFAPADFEHASVTVFRYLIMLVALTVILARKKVKLADLFILAGLLYLSWQSRRYMALFAIFSCLMLPGFLDYIYFSAKEWFIKKKIWLPKVNLAFGILGFAVLVSYILKTDMALANNKYYMSDQRWRRFGIGISEIVYPIGAANFVEQNNLLGNMYNDYGSGTYLNWKLYPAHKTFIDGHTYTLDLLQEHKSINAGEISYQDAVNKYGINYFLLDYVNGDTLSLVTNLYKDPNWKPVYFDENSVIFVADKPENQDLIKKFSLDLEKNINYDPNSLPTFKQKANLSFGFADRAGLLATIGLTNQSLDQYRKAVELDSTNYLAQLNFGKISYKLGDKEAALTAYKNSLTQEYYFAPTHFSLGVYYFDVNKLDDAIMEFQEALAINKSYLSSHYNLGVIYEAQGDKARALEEYQAEVKINPNQTQAEDSIKRLVK